MNQFTNVHYAGRNQRFTAETIYQYDRGRQMRIYGLDDTATIQVQYAILGMKQTLTDIPSYVDNIWVSNIPNILLAQTNEIQAYIYISNDTYGQTVVHVSIPITPRTKPDGYQYTETELRGIEYVLTQLNTALRNAETASTHASAAATAAETASANASAAVTTANNIISAAKPLSNVSATLTSSAHNATPTVQLTQTNSSTNFAFTIPKYSTQPRNLLDNSDFTNPVNQRGQVSYAAPSGAPDNIDRWYANRATVNVETGYITLLRNTTTSTSATYIGQKMTNIEHLTGKTLTLAFMTDIGLFCGSFVFTDVNITILSQEGWTIAYSTSAKSFVIQTSSKNSIKLYWAALYEGSYTAETLPPYVPKGYAAELLACQVADTGELTANNSEKFAGKPPESYISPRNLLDNSDFRHPVNQRGYTTWMPKPAASDGTDVPDGGVTPPEENIEPDGVSSPEENTEPNDSGDGEIVEPDGVVPDGADSTIRYIEPTEQSIYTIDRWKTTNPYTTVKILNDGIQLTNTTANSGGFLHQSLEHSDQYLGKTLTLAVMQTKGTLSVASATIPSAFDTASNKTTQLATLLDEGVSIGAIQVYKSTISVRIWSNPNETTRSFSWVALYEGAYTAETLPPYMYKGYEAELDECYRYFRRFDAQYSFVGSGFVLKSGAAAYIALNLGTMARNVTPTITGSVHVAVPTAATNTAPVASTFEAVSAKSGWLRLICHFAPAQTEYSGNPCAVTIRSGDYLEISVER